MTTEIEELLKPLRLAVAEQVSPHFTKYLQQLKLKNLFLKGWTSQETQRWKSKRYWCRSSCVWTKSAQKCFG